MVCWSAETPRNESPAKISGKRELNPQSIDQAWEMSTARTVKFIKVIYLLIDVKISGIKQSRSVIANLTMV